MSGSLRMLSLRGGIRLEIFSLKRNMSLFLQLLLTMIRIKLLFPDVVIIFLQEHEVDIRVVEDDPINFHQAMQISNSQKWIDAMN